MKNPYETRKIEALEGIEEKKHPEAALPADCFSVLMDDQLSRGFLNRMDAPDEWKIEPSASRQSFGWLKFVRLPVGPDGNDDGKLMENWQSVLSACHTLGIRLAFILIRAKGKTGVYVGACYPDGRIQSAANVLKQSMTIHMPGAELAKADDWDSPDFLLSKLSDASGVVTGIPSLRESREGSLLQTLDKLAKGISVQGNDKEYALVVLADPAKDDEISNLQQTLLRLKTEVHQLASYNESLSTSDSFTSGRVQGNHLNAGTGMLLGHGMMAGTPVMTSAPLVANLVGSAVAIATQIAGGASLAGRAIQLLGGALTGYSRSWSSQESATQNASDTVSREHRDFIATYAESLIDRHVRRMEGGRSLGFWQTGMYVLSDESDTVDSVLALLRSIYSGKDSFVEPIRVFNTTKNHFAAQCIRDLRFLALPVSKEARDELSSGLDTVDGHWHALGRMHESFTTALTTQELSISTSLPRRDVPGLRFVKNAVHFAANPYTSKENAIELGNIVDMGAVQNTPYTIDVNALVRHALITGGTGSGKSTTCKQILKEALERKIPVMIIEPAKDDYVRWALEMNKQLPEDMQFEVFMPGMDEIGGQKLSRLSINPFEPAAWKDAPVSLLQHSENFATLLNAALPSQDVIPILIDEAVNYCIRVKALNAGIDIDEYENPQMTKYPTMVSLKCAGNTVISRKTYAQQNKDNFEEILRTRFVYLSRGLRGSILNAEKSVDFNRLFSRPAVINLSRLSGSRDKSLVMSLLLLALYEYRISQYTYDDQYRAEASKNKLMHLMLIEEAHNVLMKPSPAAFGNSPEQAAADLFTNMLSEIRSYGQGMMIADQVPTRLIDDAIKNTNYKIAHRMTAPDDCAVMASGMGLRDEQAAILTSLEIGNAIICGDRDDAAAWVKIKKPS
ncbi:MAG: ATP-binding protein [Clostridia bacterium]|nr:ATP-binding protein [Clostridia bacterium]